MLLSMDNKKSDCSDEWISVRHLQHFVASGDGAGLPMNVLLRQVGLSRREIANADGRVSVEQLEHLLALITARVDVPLGLYLARDIKPATLGAIGFIAQVCETFGDVLEMATRFNGLLSNIGHASISHGPGVVRLHWECQSVGTPIFHRHATEYVLGACVCLTRWLLPEGESLFHSVSLPHGKPAGHSEQAYQSLFDCPVYFHQATACVEMPARVCQIPLQHGDASLKGVLESHAQNLMARRQQPPSLTEQVEEEIRAQITRQSLDKEAVARRLGISARSLQRRLREEGSSYRELLDRVRFALASERLSDHRQTLGDIAGALCFGSHQAFIRWFKERQGLTPGEYRKIQPNSG